VNAFLQNVVIKGFSTLASELVPTKMGLRVGHRLGSAHYFNGMMDEVAIFEGALDENDIQILGIDQGISKSH